MRLTARGRTVVVLLAVLLGLVLGLSAHLWNPWAAPANSTLLFEDGAGIVYAPDGTRLITFCTTGALCDD